MVTQLIFETARLGVRPLQTFDFNAFHEMQSNPRVMQFAAGRIFSAEENRQQLAQCIAKYSEPGNDYWVWAITLKADGKFIGTCAIVPNQNRPEIGYRLLETEFKKGFGREICNGLIHHAIDTMEVQEIVAVADCRNLASVKILDRSVLPFVEELRQSEQGSIDRFYHWKRD